MPRSIIHVHHRGDRGVDGILRLIDLASHDGPLETMLTAMCDELAAIAGVDVASIYVREDDRLVMRGNHGFPPSAIGTTLAVGEGITGLVAECMRPVSAAHAATEAAYKHVPGLGEERFPVFAGVPLISGGAVAGVLVLQRRKKPFAADEVTLATALVAPVTLAVERRRAAAIRSARLHGTAHAVPPPAPPVHAPDAATAPLPSTVLGRAGIVPTSTAIAAAPIDVDRSIGRLRDQLSQATRRLADCTDARIGGALDRFALALCDQRLHERLVEVAGQPAGLRAVAKDYIRARHKLGGPAGSFDDERVSEIEELTALIGVTADARTSVRPGAIWIADQIGSFVALAAVARGATALVAADTASPTAIAIAAAARLPLVTHVSGLFGWVRPGDLLAVDGASGTVLVHPAPTEIERLRRERQPLET